MVTPGDVVIGMLVLGVLWFFIEKGLKYFDK